MSAKTNLEIIKDAYEAFRHGDVDAVSNVEDPAAELESLPPTAI